jgi:hypothetical protein
MATPASSEAEFIKTRCADFSGDGNGDSGWKPLAGTINPELQKALDAGDFALLLEFRDVTDFGDTAHFSLVGLYGRPEPGGDGYLVDPLSYATFSATAVCAPTFVFDGATIDAGQLSAGPIPLVVPFTAAFTTGTVDFTLTFEDVRITATIVDDGVTATEGVISSLLQKAQVYDVVEKLDAFCLSHPAEPSCGYTTGRSALPMLFDLDLDKDGKKDAASICFKFTLKAGTIVGLKP